MGASQASAHERALAEAVGAGLARAGAVLVCGGRGGVMAAACRGAASAGGLTVGLLPGFDRREANEWVRVALPTGLGELRNALVARAGDAMIAVGGSYGTLSEVALALRADTPVIGLRSWDIEGVRIAAGPDEAVALALKLAPG